MKVEIWSDVMCPFCYMGKRKFEMALEQFEGKDQVEITWKSYQLNPLIKTDTSIRIDEYLSKEKGISPDKAREMNDYVTEAGKKVGLDYHFDTVVVANSFLAHRFLHYAASLGLQLIAGERLFHAYFTQGLNTDDLEVLIQIGKEAGIEENALRSVLLGDKYSEEVKQDIHEARMLGVSGVPFFVFDRKYAISGAQEPETFLKALRQTASEAV